MYFLMGEKSREGNEVKEGEFSVTAVVIPQDVFLEPCTFFQRHVSSPTAYMSELDVRIMLVILRRFRL